MGSAVTVVAEERNSLSHIARTTIAALASQLIAQSLHMPEPYWATVTTIVVMQSSLGAAWTVSWKRLAGTVLGGAVGGFLTSYVGGNLIAFGAAMVGTGLVCLLLKEDRSAYRFAGITLTIIMLIPRAPSPWIVAIHRCVEGHWESRLRSCWRLCGPKEFPLRLWLYGPAARNIAAWQIMEGMLRDPNLVPLSRQHQHALALCVRINRAALATPGEVKAWQSEIQQHFEQEIRFHFAAEEKHLFPAARQYPELVSLADELVAEHKQLREYFAQSAARALDEAGVRRFAEALSGHIRKEERRLFEELQRRMTPAMLAEIGEQIDQALGAGPEACITPTESILKNL